MSAAPWRSVVRRVHGLHRRQPADWQTCEVDECDAIPVGRPDATRCLRHLPAGQARKEALKAMLRRYTVEGPRGYVRVDLRGNVFDERLLNETLGQLRDPSEDAPALAWDFQKCTFTGRADFTDVVFGNVLRPRDTYVDFTDARFEDAAVFTRARFHAPAFFENTRFTTADFDQAAFDHDAWFLRTRLATGMFSDTAFARGAYFHEVSANSLALPGAQFAGPVHLEPVTVDHLDLTHATFTERATLHLQGSGVLDDADFGAGVDVLLVPPPAPMEENVTGLASLNMSRTRLGAASTVTGDLRILRAGGDHEQRVGRGDYPQITSDLVDAKVILTGSVRTVPEDDERDVHRLMYPRLPKITSLTGTDVAELTVTDVDLGSCRFAGALNLDKLRLLGKTPFAQPRRSELLSRTGKRRRSQRPIAREMLLDEFDFGSNPVVHLHFRNGRRFSSKPVADDQLAGLYRALRKALEDSKNEPGAGDMYYGEMEARRRASHRPSEYLVLWVYRALSGYGQRVGRALAWLLSLVIVLIVLLVEVGLPDTTNSAQRMTGTLQPMRASGEPQDIALEVRTPPALLPTSDRRWTLDRVERAARVATGSVVFRDTDQQLTAAGRWTVNGGRLLGPLLIALTALAIRARVKR